MSPNPDKQRATGKIKAVQVTASAFAEADAGPKLLHLDIDEVFSGDIEGTATVRFLQAMFADGSGSFCGIERVSGTLAGRQGTFLLQDVGTIRGNQVLGTWFVIPTSGTGGLSGLRGEGGFEADLGKEAAIWLNYWWE
jgi:hypothetical protein